MLPRTQPRNFVALKHQRKDGTHRTGRALDRDWLNGRRALLIAWSEDGSQTLVRASDLVYLTYREMLAQERANKALRRYHGIYSD